MEQEESLNSANQLGAENLMRIKEKDLIFTIFAECDGLTRWLMVGRYRLIVLTFSYSVSETVERQLDGIRTLRLPAGSRSLTTDSAPVEPAAYDIRYTLTYREYTQCLRDTFIEFATYEHIQRLRLINIRCTMSYDIKSRHGRGQIIYILIYNCNLLCLVSAFYSYTIRLYDISDARYLVYNISTGHGRGHMGMV